MKCQLKHVNVFLIVVKFETLFGIRDTHLHETKGISI